MSDFEGRIPLVTGGNHGIGAATAIALAESGFDVIESLQKNKPTASIPIIVVTAYISEENRTRAHELGIRTFLQKPLTYEELIGAIMSTVPAVKKFGK